MPQLRRSALGPVRDHLDGPEVLDSRDQSWAPDDIASRRALPPVRPLIGGCRTPRNGLTDCGQRNALRGELGASIHLA